MSFATDNRHLDAKLNIISANQKGKLFIFLAIELMRTNQYQIGFDKCKHSLKYLIKIERNLFTMIKNRKNLQLGAGTNASTGSGTSH